jgi:hypothetical protein
MYDKYFNDQGEVAILVSGGYSAGWSTWNHEHGHQLCEDARLIKALVDKNNNIDALCADIFGDDAWIYTGGWNDCCIAWLPKGTQYRIDEYDGSESLEVLSEQSFYVAGE